MVCILSAHPGAASPRRGVGQMASWGEPGGRPEGRNPSGQRTEQLVEAVAFISVTNNKYIPIETFERHMESLQAAGRRLNTVCPQHGDKVAVAAGLPIKPSQVQSHCAAGHRFFFPRLRSLSSPCFFPLCLLVAWGSELPRCLLGIAQKGSVYLGPPELHLRPWPGPVSETTQLSVRVTGVGGG